MVVGARSALAWHGTFSSSGSLTYTGAFGLSKTYDFPNRMFCNLTQDSVWTCDAIQDDNVASVHLGLTDYHGQFFKSLTFTIPDGDHLVTYFFRSSHRAAWLSLRSGESSALITADNKYRIAMQRTASSTWRLNVADITSHHDLDVTITMTTDAPSPSWRLLSYFFQGSIGSAHFTGHLRAVRVA
jgi:hypothetical protein